MGYSAFDVLPKSFADFLIAHAAEKVAQQMELTIWDGNNASAGEFSGIMRQLDVDATPILFTLHGNDIARPARV